VTVSNVGGMRSKLALQEFCGAGTCDSCERSKVIRVCGYEGVNYWQFAACKGQQHVYRPLSRMLLTELLSTEVLASLSGYTALTMFEH
jgi:hypothetical protein